MKKLSIFIALITLFSCKKEPIIDYAIISGTISNSEAKEMKLYKEVNMSVLKKLNLSESGVFKDTVFLKENSLFVLYQGKNPTALYLSAGDDISINYDSKEYKKTIKINGKGSKVAEYLYAKITKKKEIFGESTDGYKKGEKEYKELISKIKTTQEDLLFNVQGVSEDFKKAEGRNINFGYLEMLNKYELYHGYYTKNREFKVSENFLDELKAITLDNENDFNFSSSYNSLVTSKYRKEADVLAKKDSIDTDIAMLKVSNTIAIPSIKNSLLYDAAKYGITYTVDLEAFYSLYIKGSTDEENNTKITKSYNGLKSLAQGNPSPKFTDYENHAGGVTSLDDLKGKYVYVDVWATWCGPCIREIPSLKKVEKKYHGKNIEFVSLSIDKMKDHEKWQKMIGDKELGGMQLFADNDWESKFVEDYMIKGIPRFILIDPSGNIVNANAPRPSDNKLTTTLNDLNL